MPLQTSLLEIIDQSPLSATTKAFFTRKVKKEGATSENITALQELLKAVQEQALATMTSGLNDDPDVQVAMKDMQMKVSKAAEDYATSMKKLEQASERMAADLQDDLKHLETIVINSAKAEA